MKLNTILNIPSKTVVAIFVDSSKCQKYTIIFEKVTKIQSFITFSEFVKGIFKNKRYISEEACNFRN